MIKRLSGIQKDSIRKPILIIPNVDLIRSRMLEPYSSIFTNAAPSTIVANHPQDSSGARTMTQAQWAWLATQHPDLFKDFMQFPQDPQVLGEIARLAVSAEFQAVLQQGLPLDPPPFDRYIDITAMPSNLIGGFLARMQAQSNALLHVVLQADRGRYRVEIDRLPRDPGTEVANPMFSEAWRQSSVDSAALRFMLTDREVGDMVTKGARVMLIPGEAAIESPLLTALSEGEEGVPQFWFPGEDGATHGSSVSLLLPYARERRRVSDLLEIEERAAIQAWQRGFVPAAALDLDGTLFNARLWTTILFMMWAKLYDGPSAGDVRGSIVQAFPEELRPRLMRWLDDRDEGRDATDYLDDEAIELANLVADGINGWNGRQILEHMMVEQETVFPDAALTSAGDFHNAYFFNPELRTRMVTIPGMMDFARLLRDRLAARGVPLMTFIVTLRSPADDDLPGGISASEISLRKAGLWDDNSVLLRWQGPQIDWSVAAFKSGKNEPEKWEIVKADRLANPKRPVALPSGGREFRKIWYVAYKDNAPAHVISYRKLFGHNIIQVHVQRDLPPGSPELPPGVHTVEPVQAKREIEEMGGVPLPSLDRLSAPISGPAFAALVERLKAARAEGKRPVAIFGIDDTLLASSKRVKKVLHDFVTEWVRAHPGKEWALELTRRFTPMAVEYGPRDILSQAGLENLGLEEEFERYFAQHFLGAENGEHPLARQDAAAFTAQLQALGVRIVYLSARMKDGIGTRVLRNLRTVGLPVNERGVDLVLRQDAMETDEAFKARALKNVVEKNESLVGIFDNEPAVLVEARRIHPSVPLFLVGDQRIADAPDLPGDVVSIMNFAGKIGRLRPRLHPPVGTRLREEGSSLAGSIFSSLADIWDASTTPADIKEQQQQIDRAARDAVTGLQQVALLDPMHPKHTAFLGAINGAFAGRSGALERRFEDILDVVNQRTRHNFVSLRGPEGLHQLIEAHQGSLDPRKILFLPPTTIEPEPFSIAPGIAGMDLQVVLPSIARGPKLQQLTDAERYDALVFGGLTETFPRMDFALSWLVGSLMMQTGKKAHELFIMEYGPRLSLAPMIGLARMGVNVGWWDNVDAKRLQTEHAIRQLPEKVRSKIKQSQPSKKAKPDAVIGNMLPRGVSLKGLAKESFSSVIVLQSEKDASSFEKDLPEGTPWECVSEVPLDANDYVLPSAFLSDGQVSPATFQVWKAR